MTVGAYIVHHFDLFFDGGNHANDSLYLCFEPGTPSAAVGGVIDKLRSADMWSERQCMKVLAEQRSAYATQMQFVACAQFQIEGSRWLMARYTHPKFPSNAERWSLWLKLFA